MRPQNAAQHDVGDDELQREEREVEEQLVERRPAEEHQDDSAADEPRTRWPARREETRAIAVGTSETENPIASRPNSRWKIVRLGRSRIRGPERTTSHHPAGRVASRQSGIAKAVPAATTAMTTDKRPDFGLRSTRRPRRARACRSPRRSSVIGHSPLLPREQRAAASTFGLQSARHRATTLDPAGSRLHEASTQEAPTHEAPTQEAPTHEAPTQDAPTHGSTNPRGTNPGRTNPRSTNPGGTNPRRTNPGRTNPRGTNPGRHPDPTTSTNPGRPTHEDQPKRTNPRGTDPRSTNPRGTNPRRTNPRGTNPRGTNPEHQPTSTNPGSYQPTTTPTHEVPTHDAPTQEAPTHEAPFQTVLTPTLGAPSNTPVERANDCVAPTTVASTAQIGTNEAAAGEHGRDNRRSAKRSRRSPP